MGRKARVRRLADPRTPAQKRADAQRAQENNERFAHLRQDEARRAEENPGLHQRVLEAEAALEEANQNPNRYTLDEIMDLEDEFMKLSEEFLSDPADIEAVCTHCGLQHPPQTMSILRNNGAPDSCARCGKSGLERKTANL